MEKENDAVNKLINVKFDIAEVKEICKEIEKPTVYYEKDQLKMAHGVIENSKDLAKNITRILSLMDQEIKNIINLNE